MAIKSRESKMLSQVRLWRKEAYEADKTESLPERAKEDEKLAREFGLPIIAAHKADSTPRQRKL